MPQVPHRTAVKVFNQPAMATPLLLAFTDIFGLEPLVGDDEQRWDPQTIEMEMADISGGCLPQNLDKLMCAAEIVGTNNFERSLPDFIRICNVLADSPTDGTFDPAEVREIAWAVIEGGLLAGQRPVFEPEIASYIAKMLKDEGFTAVPSPLDVVLPDPDVGWENTNQDTEDPELFAMTQDANDGREQELSQYLSERLSRMIQEIQRLPLTAPQADWIQNISQELKALLTNENQSTNGEMA